MKTRTFKIVTEPHVADPCHQIPVIELTEDQPIMYTSTDVIKKVLADMEYEIAFNAGYSKGTSYILDGLGITFKEFLARRKNQDSQI